MSNHFIKFGVHKNPFMIRPLDMPSFYSDNHILHWMLDSYVRIPTERITDMRLIYADICKIFDLTQDQIKSKTRVREVIIPRHISMYVMSRITDETLSDIGRFFNTDHSVILYAIDSVKKMIDTKDSLFMSYWDAYKHYSNFYVPALENTGKQPKRYAASLQAIKNDLLEVFNFNEKEFFNSRWKGTNNGRDIIYYRLIFNYISLKIGHKRGNIVKYLGQYTGYSTKAEIQINNHFKRRNYKMIRLWEEYISRSSVHTRLAIKKHIAAKMLKDRAA